MTGPSKDEAREKVAAYLSSSGVSMVMARGESGCIPVAAMSCRDGGTRWRVGRRPGVPSVRGMGGDDSGKSWLARMVVFG